MIGKWWWLRWQKFIASWESSKNLPVGSFLHFHSVPYTITVFPTISQCSLHTSIHFHSVPYTFTAFSTLSQCSLHFQTLSPCSLHFHTLSKRSLRFHILVVYLYTFALDSYTWHSPAKLSSKHWSTGAKSVFVSLTEFVMFFVCICNCICVPIV